MGPEMHHGLTALSSATSELPDERHMLQRDAICIQAARFSLQCRQDVMNLSTQKDTLRRSQRFQPFPAPACCCCPCKQPVLTCPASYHVGVHSSDMLHAPAALLQLVLSFPHRWPALRGRHRSLKPSGPLPAPGGPWH
jgi:hypothetical protein